MERRVLNANETISESTARAAEAAATRAAAPVPTTASAFERAQVAYEAGVDLARAGCYAQAALRFTVVITTVNVASLTTTRTIYGRNCNLVGPALGNRAFCYLKEGMTENALRDATAAVQLLPESPELRLLRARVLFEGGGLKDCVADCSVCREMAAKAGAVVDENVVCHAVRLQHRAEAELRFMESDEIPLNDGTPGGADEIDGDCDDVLEDYWRPLHREVLGSSQATPSVSSEPHVYVPKAVPECARRAAEFLGALHNQVAANDSERLRYFTSWLPKAVECYIMLCDIEGEKGSALVEGERSALSGAAAGDVLDTIAHHLRNALGDRRECASAVHSFGMMALPFQLLQHEMQWRQAAQATGSSLEAEGASFADQRRATAKAHLQYRSMSRLLRLCREADVLPPPQSTTAVLLLVNVSVFAGLAPDLAAESEQADVGTRWCAALDAAAVAAATHSNGSASSPHEWNTALNSPMIASAHQPLGFILQLLDIVSTIHQRRRSREAASNFFVEAVRAIVPPGLREIVSEAAAARLDYLPRIEDDDGVYS